ncbi:MAG: hypothetical protein ACUZ77_07940 [Candidatus Brocadiales bacterium]
MKRNKALGHDPLAWIKATKEAESKARTEGAESKTRTKGTEFKKTDEVPKTEEQEAPELETTPPEIKKPEVVEEAVIEETVIEETEKSPSIETPQPVQKTIRARQERIHITPEQGYMTTKEGFVEGGVKAPYGTTRTIDLTTPVSAGLATPHQKERQGTSIIFIIVYAVLLLVLTLFVYFNLSKRMDVMSSRISNIEKVLSMVLKEKGVMR